MLYLFYFEILPYVIKAFEFAFYIMQKQERKKNEGLIIFALPFAISDSPEIQFSNFKGHDDIVEIKQIDVGMTVDY